MALQVTSAFGAHRFAVRAAMLISMTLLIVPGEAHDIGAGHISHDRAAVLGLDPSPPAVKHLDPVMNATVARDTVGRQRPIAPLSAHLSPRSDRKGAHQADVHVSLSERVTVTPLEEGNGVRALLAVIFLLGLLMIALEDVLCINKSAVTLVIAPLMWIILAASTRTMDSKRAPLLFSENIGDDLQEVGGVILFLFPAMAIVESIDHFGGFEVVTRLILLGMAGKRWRLMPIMTMLTFFLSAVLDNLTATIVALKILRHTVPDDRSWRHSCGGLVVLASNAGGAWSPIGDVTTTMLWISGKISASRTVEHLIFPSLVAICVPLAGMMIQQSRAQKGSLADEEAPEMRVPSSPVDPVSSQQIFVLIFGLSCILAAPLLKVFLELPPYMGMVFGLGVLWLITDCIGLRGAKSQEHCGGSGKEEHVEESGPWSMGVVQGLKSLDQTGLFFFTGILFAVGALDSGGVLKSYSILLMQTFGSTPLPLCYFLGMSSAIVDNVPLVQAAIDMYKDVPQDDTFWQLVAVSAGVGGSLLSIGSAAGVMLMGMEGVEFGWYLKNVTPLAFMGFFASIWAYNCQQAILY